MYSTYFWQSTVGHRPMLASSFPKADNGGAKIWLWSIYRLPRCEIVHKVAETGDAGVYGAAVYTVEPLTPNERPSAVWPVCLPDCLFVCSRHELTRGRPAGL